MVVDGWLCSRALSLAGWLAAAANPRRLAAPTRAHLISVLFCIPALPACLQNNYQAESNTCLMGDTFEELVTHADDAFKWINEGTEAVCAACTAAPCRAVPCCAVPAVSAIAPCSLTCQIGLRIYPPGHMSACPVCCCRSPSGAM